MTILHHLHAWLTAFATSHNLKPQLELSREHLHLVVGSPTLGRCEIGSVEIKTLTTWGKLEQDLEANREAYTAKLTAHLRHVDRYEVVDVLSLGSLENVSSGI